MNILIIQAHMGSTRLPGKVMKKICGKEILMHVYTRCKKVKLVDKVIIATSTDKDNDEIERFCELNEIECFRGAEKDVLDRYYECAKIYDPHFIVRVTSDCPLLEPKLIDYWLENAMKDNIDFVDEEEEIFTGSGVDIFSFKALEIMKEKAFTEKQKEHVVGYYYDNKDEFFDKKYRLPKELQHVYRDYRLTLDTKEDFELIEELYSRFYEDDFVNLDKVISYIDKNIDILRINENIKQKKY